MTYSASGVVESLTARTCQCPPFNPTRIVAAAFASTAWIQQASRLFNQYRAENFAVSLRELGASAIQRR
jgi:hypothetical protein